MAFLGADMGEMVGLTAKLTTAGGHFVTHSSTIVAKLKVAAEELKTTMATLETEAKTIAGEVEATSKALHTEANATDWTGKNRSDHDAALEQFVTSIGSIKTGMETFASDARSIVDGHISTACDETGAKVTQFSGSANEVAASLSAGVAMMKTRLQEALGDA